MQNPECHASLDCLDQSGLLQTTNNHNYGIIELQFMSPEKWSAENPIGTFIRYRGSRTEHRVASRAFWTSTPGPMVLLDDGNAVGIDCVERVPESPQGHFINDTNTSSQNHPHGPAEPRFITEDGRCLLCADLFHSEEIQKLRSIVNAQSEALNTAINSVECDSIDKDGKELPWYSQAKKALAMTSQM